MARRKKKRTHLPKEETHGPKSFVLRSGEVDHNVHTLIKDVRRMMEPNTAIRLKQRKRNKTKDFINVAGQLGVTHAVSFSQTSKGTNLRIARFPRGPTLYFKVHEFSNTKDVLSIQKKPHLVENDFKTSPLVVLNNFGSKEQHVKLMTVMFQNMFPAINVQNIKLSDAKRVVLFNLEGDVVQMRHYSITVKQVGISKSIKRILKADNLNLGNFNDISDFIETGGALSESEAEDGPENTFQIKEKQRAIRLHEIGPRLEMSLLKIQEGFCDGPVVYHAYVTKTRKEVSELNQRKEQERALKKARREEQEANVKRKQNAKDEPAASDDDEAAASEEEFEFDEYSDS